MPWWGYIALGVGVILFSAILYKYRNSPNVEFEGGSPRTVTTFAIIVGLVLIAVGFSGYFIPAVIRGWETLSKVMESLSEIWDILGFLAVQALLICALLYALVWKTIIKREKSDLLPIVLIFTALSAIYWVWIFAAKKLESVYIEPFQYIHNLLFE
jgi:hypothetical protein